MSLSKTLYPLLSTCSTQEDPSRHNLKLVDWDVKNFVCLFVFVALRPMSTAIVIAGRSVHLTTLFPGQACASG